MLLLGLCFLVLLASLIGSAVDCAMNAYRSHRDRRIRMMLQAMSNGTATAPDRRQTLLRIHFSDGAVTNRIWFAFF